MGGWDKGNVPWRRISRSEIRKITAAKKSESESEGGQKFLPRRVAKRLLRGVPPNPLPFCPPERLDFRIRSLDFRQKKFGF